jgi:hypothetical protein
MIDTTLDRQSLCVGLPLCRRYHVVSFKSLSAPVIAGESAIDVPMHWALGGLVDGQVEVLGAWLESSSRRPFWGGGIEELADRGVERVRVVVTEEPAAARAAYPHTLFLAPATTLMQEISSAGDMSRRQWRAVVRSAQQAEGIQVEIARRVQRRAPFRSAPDALRFVEKALRLAESRVWASAVIPGNAGIRSMAAHPIDASSHVTTSYRQTH